MNTSRAILLLAATLCACASGEERVQGACRVAIRGHLVDPASADLTVRRIAHRPGGWEARLTVEARDLDGKIHESPVTCRTDERFQVVDLADD